MEIKSIRPQWCKLEPLEIILLTLVGILFPPLLIYSIIVVLIDYEILKNYFFKKQKWDLNISCGKTDGGGLNADIAKREVPNFVLIKDIYNLPFKDKQFANAICSHTIEHVEDPEKFYNELRRVSQKVVLLVPPIWDIFALVNFKEHKWQFLTLKAKHVNFLPRKFKLPYWWYQKKFGQRIGG